ncbi:glycosyltransferase family 2 protein [Aeromicrobium duanguangcaii]|uniref:Glycosyltransferase n=1 Tax=Aeromicrobium duanguangcaii TaxID=2968086 RepID=A0ABY5KFY7_9ACTN|nr:glycosyltransferase [Aeromicrobium duanguangcaii]MCD9154169.1 glycosyltransferase [Aeromicrobium duanguangcaii]UUI68760.1 glycosyltransferase [Aeromicrobium duanguangcaii]
MDADEGMTAPRFSLLTRVTDAGPEAFAVTAASVAEQSLPGWEWVVALAPSASSQVRDALRDAAAGEPRIIVLESDGDELAGGLAAGLAAASGDFVGLLDLGDTLTRRALEFVSKTIDAAGDDLDVVYTDHDEPEADGPGRQAYYKPDWSPERLRHHAYVGWLCVLRRSTLVEAGGFRPDAGSAAALDALLRVTERGGDVQHVRRVLYRRNGGAPHEDADAVTAVQEHLDRVGIAATVAPSKTPGLLQIDRRPDVTTTTSVIIPTIGTAKEIWGTRRNLVTETVRTVAEHSRHEDLEFVIVYDPPTPEEVLEELRALRESHGLRIRLVVFTEKFNFSAKCNVGAAYAAGDVLVFLNDDMAARSDAVIEDLIAPLREPGVGATGGKLFFEDGTVQHGGVRFGSGHLSDPYRRASADALGERGELQINREVTVLTGACVAVRREVFEEVGGFSERFPMNFNDVDFGLKIARAGLRSVWLHDVQLWHFESVSRDNTVRPWEFSRLEQRWGSRKVVRERYSNNVR